MSSTNKTKKLGLNSWIGSDKPKRIDFNTDNEIIEQAITQHTEDTVVHIDDSERERWNNYMFTGMYYGTGSTERVVETKCPFKARFGIVFANNRTVTVAYFPESKKTNYLGFFSYLANTLGVKLNKDQQSFTVENSVVAMTANEYANFNQNGVAYNYIMFR